MRFFHRLELEWKVLLLAAVLFVAFAWPVQRYFISRLSEALKQSIDPHLEQTLRTQSETATGEQRQQLTEHIKRYRQTRVLIPIIVTEQQRLLLALSAGLFILFLFLAFWVLKSLTRPLKNLAASVKKIGKGEITDVARVSGGALGIVEQSVANLQDELVVLREKARMQGMEAAWKDIARVMAHEIKNPLTPIRLTIDRIEDRATSRKTLSNEELIKFITRINTQVDMLERLVDQFRSFSREPDINLSQITVVDCIRSTTDALTPKITTKISGNTTIQSDPYLLRQIFLNIWKNSLEAGADVITVAVTATKQLVTLTITDNGTGITDNDLKRIWLPYVTLKSGGTGLGLPVVKLLVETLHGSIALASPPGKGVTITLTFPVLLRKE